MILARNCCAHHSSRSMGTKSVGRAEGWAVMSPPNLSASLPLKPTTSPSLRPQMWQATVKMWVRFKSPLCPGTRTWQGPGHCGREWRGLPEGGGGLTLQSGVGGPLDILHRPRTALTGWATTQLLLHLLPGCRERTVRLNQASLSPPPDPRATLDHSPEVEVGSLLDCRRTNKLRAQEEPSALAAASQVTVGKRTRGPGHTLEPPNYLRTQSGHSLRGPVCRSPGSPRWMGMW